MKPAKLAAHLLAEGGVEVAEGFVQEEGVGLADEGAAEGDSLSLSAGELSGFSLK